MALFDDIQDVEEWLEPLDYLAFWKAVAPYNLTLQDRDQVEGLIAGGKLDQALALKVLKELAQMELSKTLRLKDRVYHPVIPSIH